MLLKNVKFHPALVTVQLAIHKAPLRHGPCTGGRAAGSLAGCLSAGRHLTAVWLARNDAMRSDCRRAVAPLAPPSPVKLSPSPAPRPSALACLVLKVQSGEERRMRR